MTQDNLSEEHKANPDPKLLLRDDRGSQTPVGTAALVSQALVTC